jgi:hypothetical protein
MFVIYYLEKKENTYPGLAGFGREQTCVAPAVEPEPPNNNFLTREGGVFNPGKFAAEPD